MWGVGLKVQETGFMGLGVRSRIQDAGFRIQR